MDKKLYPLFVALLISAPFSASGNDNKLIHGVLRSFFAALQTGDTAVIESWIGGDLFEEKKVLLRKNKAYPQFLRQYYQGATFKIANVTHKDGQASAELIVTFPSGELRRIPLRLAKEPDPGLSRGNGEQHAPPPLRGLAKGPGPGSDLSKRQVQNGWKIMKHTRSLDAPALNRH